MAAMLVDKNQRPPVAPFLVYQPTVCYRIVIHAPGDWLQTMYCAHLQHIGLVNGKIRDLPRSQDPS